MSSTAVVRGCSRIACLLTAVVCFETTYLRVAHEPLHVFDYDAGDQVGRALDVLEGRSYPLLGRSLAGQVVRLGPFADYVLVLPLALGRSPGSLVVFFAAAAGIASAGLVWLGWRYFGPSVGALAGLLHSFNATILEWAAWLYSVGLVPVFSVLVICVTLRSLERRSRFPVLAGVCVGLTSQCHIVGLSFLPVLPLAALMAGRPRIAELALHGAPELATAAAWARERIPAPTATVSEAGAAAGREVDGRRGRATDGDVEAVVAPGAHDPPE